MTPNDTIPVGLTSLPALAPSSAIHNSDRVVELLESIHSTLKLKSAGDAECLTPDEAASLMKISRRQLDRLYAAGDGPLAVRIGDKKNYRVASVIEWLRQQEQKSAKRR